MCLLFSSKLLEQISMNLPQPFAGNISSFTRSPVKIVKIENTFTIPPSSPPRRAGFFCQTQNQPRLPAACLRPLNRLPH